MSSSSSSSSSTHTRVFQCDARDTCAAYVNYLEEYITGRFRRSICLYSKENKYCWCANNDFNCTACTPPYDRRDSPIFCSALVKQSREMSLYAVECISELCNDTESRYLLSIEVTISKSESDRSTCDANIVLLYTVAESNHLFKEISRVEVTNLPSLRVTCLLLAKRFKSILSNVIRNQLSETWTYAHN